MLQNIRNYLLLFRGKIFNSPFIQFIIIFFGTSYYAYTQTVLGGIVCPFCGAPMYTHPMTASIALALGVGTATIVIGVKKISQKLAQVIKHKIKK